MGKALPFPQHRHPPSTLSPAFKLRIGALSNDQGTEAPHPENGSLDEDGSAPGSNVEDANPGASASDSSFGE